MIHLITEQGSKVRTRLLIGSLEKNLTIGDNVAEKITPETYEKMNEEFEEEGLPFRIIVPTQEQIDKWRNESDHLQQ